MPVLEAVRPLVREEHHPEQGRGNEPHSVDPDEAEVEPGLLPKVIADRVDDVEPELAPALREELILDLLDLL